MGQTDRRAGRRAVHFPAAGEEQSPEAQPFWSRAKSVKKTRGFCYDTVPQQMEMKSCQSVILGLSRFLVYAKKKKKKAATTLRQQPFADEDLITSLQQQ